MFSLFGISLRIPTSAATLDPQGKIPPRSSVAPQSIDIPCAKSPSSRESSKSITAAGPTRFRAPAPPPHPPRHICSRRLEETAFPASIPPAACPAAHRRADPAAAPRPSHAAPESAPATVRFACRTGTPHRRTTTLARAAPSRPCTHSPAKSWFLLFLTSRHSTLPCESQSPAPRPGRGLFALSLHRVSVLSPSFSFRFPLSLSSFLCP